MLQRVKHLRWTLLRRLLSVLKASTMHIYPIALDMCLPIFTGIVSIALSGNRLSMVSQVQLLNHSLLYYLRSGMGYLSDYGVSCLAMH